MIINNPQPITQGGATWDKLKVQVQLAGAPKQPDSLRIALQPCTEDAQGNVTLAPLSVPQINVQNLPQSATGTTPLAMALAALQSSLQADVQSVVNASAMPATA